MNSRIAQLIRYVVERTPEIGRTQLVKLLYLIDLEARRHLGRPITNLKYRLHKHGPFDPEILHQADLLCSENYIIESVYYCNGYKYYQYKVAEKPLPCELDREEFAIVNFVGRQYSRMPLQTLLHEVVYQTRPMQDAQQLGDLLDMGLVDGEERVPGAELERIARAVDEFDNNGGRSLDDVLAEIRGR